MDHPRDTAARRAPAAIGLALTLLVLGACSSAKGSAGAKPTTTASGSGSTIASTTTACAPPSSVPPATAVSGSTSDWMVTSFDGTRIRAHWFPVAGASAAAPAPTVLMGPGWSLPGDTDTGTSKVGLLGALTIADLHKAGYNVLTWDPRGFGASTGDVESDSPAYEGRDVSALISWVATQPGVQLDRAHDPRMGMVGASYGGGIQFVTAAADCRVDAIVPTIAWHSLGTSLYKAEIVKAGWSDLLEAAAAGHPRPAHPARRTRTGQATGQLSAADRAWFLARGPGDLVKQVTVPTLIVQGTVDTLFTLDEGVTNYEILRKQGVPVSMLWYCGGHGVCLTKTGDPQRSSRATLAWLVALREGEHGHLHRPALLVRRPARRRVHRRRLPAPGRHPVHRHRPGTLPLVATGGSGPAHIPASEQGPARRVRRRHHARATATNAVNVPITRGTARASSSAPRAFTLTYPGTVPAGTRPTRVFAQLVDETHRPGARQPGHARGRDARRQAAHHDGAARDRRLHGEARGARIMLQLVATTVAYAQPRLGGSVTFSHIGIVLPVAATLKAK